MRINKFLAQATGMSRRAADAVVAEGRVLVNGEITHGQLLQEHDVVSFGGTDYTVRATANRPKRSIILNKPAGFVVSRNGQGSKTIYELLPDQYHSLKPVGRLDKDSSGLLLLTDDGDLANQLTHPSFSKTKVYRVVLDQPLQPLHRQMISDFGIQLDDGHSRLTLDRLTEGDEYGWQVTMHEGRNRQIRRTFAALGYTVTRLHRISFGGYQLGDLQPGTFRPAEA